MSKKNRDGRGYMIKWLILLGDLGVLNIVFLLSYYHLNQTLSVEFCDDLWRVILVSNLCYLLCFFMRGVILDGRIVQSDQVVNRAFVNSLFYIVSFLCALTIFKFDSISRLFLITFFAGFCTSIIAWRFIARMTLKHYRKKGRNYRSVVFVGMSDAGLNLSRQMASDLTNGYKILGYFDDQINESSPLPYLGSIEQVEGYLTSMPIKIDEVFSTLPEHKIEQTRRILRFCEKRLIRYYIIPDSKRFVNRSLTHILMGDIVVFAMREEPLQNMVNRIVKRGFDVVMSGLFLSTLFVPMYIIIGILIKHSSSGPVFFKQPRMGRNGQYFDCYKFRSMRSNEDANRRQASEGDPRITPIGAFIRKTSLDEFPQFINVFLGDMSIVGPRPHMESLNEEYNEIIQEYMVRNLVKPGITGWAQIRGARGETKTTEDMAKRVKLDVWYIENWSLMLDIRIIVLTVIQLLKGDDQAY